jgi:hypothetical protein
MIHLSVIELCVLCGVERLNHSDETGIALMSY